MLDFLYDRKICPIALTKIVNLVTLKPIRKGAVLFKRLRDTEYEQEYFLNQFLTLTIIQTRI